MGFMGLFQKEPENGWSDTDQMMICLIEVGNKIQNNPASSWNQKLSDQESRNFFPLSFSNSQLLLISPTTRGTFFSFFFFAPAGCIPFPCKRVIHWCHLYRPVLYEPISDIVEATAGGHGGRPYARASKRRVNLPDVPAESGAPLGLPPKTWSIVLVVSGAMIYSVPHSRTKRTPAIIQAGPLPAPPTQGRPGDCGHQAAWPRGLRLLCFHWPLFLLPPSEPKTTPPHPLQPTTPLPLSLSLSHTFFTHIQIKRWAPSSLFY